MAIIQDNKDDEDEYIIQQVLKLLEGGLTESEQQEFSSLLSSSQTIRRKYLDAMQVIADLQCMYQTNPQAVLKGLRLQSSDQLDLTGIEQPGRCRE